MKIDDTVEFPTAPNPLRKSSLRNKTRAKTGLGRVLHAEKTRQRKRLILHDQSIGEKAKKIADEANAAIEAREGAFRELKAILEPRALSTIIDAVGSGLTLKQACEELGVDSSRVRKLMARDEDFRRAYFEAKESGKQLKIDMLMDIGLERAMEKSDLLYIFLMKALDPTVFNDRLVISGSGKNGELMFGTIKDLISESRFDRYEPPALEAEVVKDEKVELIEEANDAASLSGHEEALYDEGQYAGEGSGGEGGQDLQREDQEAGGAGGGAELRGEGGEVWAGEGAELPRPGDEAGPDASDPEDSDSEAEGREVLPKV